MSSRKTTKSSGPEEHPPQAAPQTVPQAAPRTVQDAQRAVDASIVALGGYWPPLANLARLFEECGELARAVNQARGPKPVKSGETAASLSAELGDVLYITLVLANSLDLDAGAALEGALARASKRAGKSVGR